MNPQRVSQLYRDYGHRILREKLDEATERVEAASKSYNDLLARAQDAQERPNSRKRIQCHLANSVSLSEEVKFKDLLKMYPPEHHLKREVGIVQRKVEKAKIRLDEAKAIYDKASAKEKSKRRAVLSIDRVYATVLSDIFREFGDIELTCIQKSTKLDVYFGGKDFPLGEGHGHWVFRGLVLIYRRDPGQKR